MKSIIAIVILLVNLSAQAADDFSPSDWGSGLHLFVGALLGSGVGYFSAQFSNRIWQELKGDL